MPNGKFDERDVKRLAEFGKALSEAFGVNLAEGMKPVRHDLSAGNQCEFILEFKNEKLVRYIDMRERFEKRQRVTEYRILIRDNYGLWHEAKEGYTIGHRQIDQLNQPVLTSAVKLFIVDARDVVDDIEIAIY